MTKRRLIKATRATAIALGVGFALWLAVPGASEAAVEGRACESEPTDMRIGYGDLINCAIDQIGDSDTFRFSGGSGETIRLQISRLDGGRGCFQLFDPGRQVARCAKPESPRCRLLNGDHASVGRMRQASNGVRGAVPA